VAVTLQLAKHSDGSPGGLGGPFTVSCETWTSFESIPRFLSAARIDWTFEAFVDRQTPADVPVVCTPTEISTLSGGSWIVAEP